MGRGVANQGVGSERGSRTRDSNEEDEELVVLS